MNVNGILFQRYVEGYYKGIEGDNWYLNEKYSEIFDEYFINNIEKSWFDSDHVDVCADRCFIERYIELSACDDIKFRMLLCETSKNKPQLRNIMLNCKFIGYDYAYAGGSYYSAVFNDVVSNRIEQFKNFKLNQNGLFEDKKTLEEFICLREKLLVDEKIELEKGDFVTYKLSEIIIPNLV